MKTRSEDDSARADDFTGETSISQVVWPLYFVVWVLLPTGITGALVLSASATMAKAERHGVPENIRPFAVAMLEVVSLAGTLLAVWGFSRSMRRDAMIAIAGASGVTLVAGWSAYGWFGAVASIALVYLVHLASKSWLELRRRRLALSQRKTDKIVVRSDVVRLADMQWPTANWPTATQLAATPPTEPDTVDIESDTIKINLVKRPDPSAQSPTESTVDRTGRHQRATEPDDSDTEGNDESDNAGPRLNWIWDAELIDRARRILDEDPGISKQKLADQLGVTKYRAAQLKDLVATEKVGA